MATPVRKSQKKIYLLYNIRCEWYIVMFILCGFNSSSPVIFLCSSVPDLLVSLRSIYDDQPNAYKRFMEKLDARIRNHDREIEKMCNFHHQGFVDAITELLKVRADAEKLMVRKED